MAPHMARMLGFRRALPQLLIAALLGGLLMVFADWCGRMVLFPYQIPAGLLATFIGGAVLRLSAAQADFVAALLFLSRVQHAGPFFISA
ncbi:Iron(III)-hydroxamate import system permease protein fhuB [Serratia rubidaea]|uniref:Iron(III)-hydroxamate import system permease protein fhuB n=1 Tax=Serratia rubidaea TaxID=61652 RepID=A0A4U9HT49_SERRU|nr:Iron(III)-hydroxamate import system permease protein fhuB [Serratia rubidaea]